MKKREGLIGGFKSVTSRKLIKLIEQNTQESRHEWLLNAFRKAGAANSNNSNPDIYRDGNSITTLLNYGACR